MNESKTNPQDDARDRLTDRVLAEAIGGETPPDQTEAIVQRAESQKAEVVVRRPWAPRVVAWGAVAASMLIALTLTLPAVKSPQSAALRALEDRAALKSKSESTWSGGSLSNSAGATFGFDEGRTKSMPEARKQLEVVQSAASMGREQRKAQVPLESPSTQAEVADGSEDQFASESDLGSVANPTQSLPQSILETLQRRDVPRADRSSRPSPYYLTDDVEYYAPKEARSVSKQAIAAAESKVAATQPTPRRPSFGWDGRRDRRWPSYVEPPSGDRYAAIEANPFIEPRGEAALSTFSIDVDTASYTNVRQYLMQSRRLPPPAAVRVEEFINYFDYGYAAPDADSEDPFAASMEVAACPWKPEHRLVRIGIKGREVAVDKRPLSNLVFLIDVSGSMNQPQKLPLVIDGMMALVDQLGENDRVAIVVYAGSEGVVLPSTSGEQKDAIRSALGRLTAGGSTAGGAGLRLAYEIAERNQITGGVNRVVLCTDGDFNVGVTGTESLATMVETRAKETGVFLTVLGFGRSNLNDEMLEAISGRGDGHYAYIDNYREARRVLSRDLSGTLVTIAKDVKLQVEFNPLRVASYRLIGYENRVMAAKDFNDDTKDAGEIGAGHTVTALYEIVPVGIEAPAPAVDGLKYQNERRPSGSDREGPSAISDQPSAESSAELLTLKIRYKRPEGGASKKLEFPLEDDGAGLAASSDDFRWASAVAEFGLWLRGTQGASVENALTVAERAVGADAGGYRGEFLDIARRARELRGR